jgi:hypothetical protein
MKLKEAWEKWKVLAEKIGNFQAKVIFSLLYFILFTPLGLIASFFKDFLSLKSLPHWEEVVDNTSTLEKLKEQ